MSDKIEKSRSFEEEIEHSGGGGSGASTIELSFEGLKLQEP